MKPDFMHLGSALEHVSTERIALRAAAYSDAWPLFEATRHPLFNLHIQWPQPENAAAAQRRMGKIIQRRERGDITAVSAVVKETGEWIALYRFIPVIDRSDSMEMGLWTHSKFWNRHFSHEITTLCIDVAFRTLPLVELIALAHPENVPCVRVLTGAGLQLIGTESRPCEHAPDIQASVFRVTRAQWQVDRGGLATYDHFDDIPIDVAERETSLVSRVEHAGVVVSDDHHRTPAISASAPQSV